MKLRTEESHRRFIDPTVGLFVSLYFILVAFFIVMNAISNQETARSIAVIESLEEAFERPFEERARASGLIPPGRHIVSDDVFLEDVGSLIAAWRVPIKRYPSTGGNIARFEIRATSLFYVNDSHLSEQAGSLFTGLIALVDGAPTGMRREISFIFGQDGEAGIYAFRRADTLAQALQVAGMAENAIVVGLDQAQSGRVIVLEMRSAPIIGKRLRNQ